MKRRIVPAALLFILLSAVICGLLWFNSAYVIINGSIISRDATAATLSGSKLPEKGLDALENLQTLDVQDIPITADQYEQLRQRLPDCDILWNIPFQNGYVRSDATHLSIGTLSMEDLAAFAYMHRLQQVSAIGCKDYDALMALKENCPELEILYTVTIGTQEVRENAAEIHLDDDSILDLLSVLPYLPELNKVDAIGVRDYESLMTLKELRPELEIHYTVSICGKDWRESTTELTLQDANAAELLSALPYLPALTDVVFLGKAPENDAIYEMMCLRPDVTFHWNFTMFGLDVSSTTDKLDLSGIPMQSTEEIESYLKYFQNLERVEMCHCGIPSDEMDALAKRHPDIRFVWAIQIGNGTLRTDAIAFIPYKIGYDIDMPLYDEDCKELKYCVDLICLDMGHMRITDYSFLEYMPKMKYLVLGDTPGKDFSPLKNLTELIYLEIFNTKFCQTEILLGFTNLQDLNLGYTRNHDIEILKQLTWLKRLWVPATGFSEKQYQELIAALPDTQIAIYVEGSTGGNWRDNQNYRDMRDLLGMYYME